MPTALEKLITIRDQTLDILVDLTASPKPTYSVGGQNVSWESYFSTLTDKLETYNKLIQQAQSPFWKVSRAKA